MESADTRNRALPIIGVILLGLILIVGAGLFLRSCASGQLALPASQGLPTPAPVAVIPTATSPAPTPPPVVPTATSPAPTPPPVVPTAAPSGGGTVIPGIEPVPVGPGDAGADSLEPSAAPEEPVSADSSVEPFPVGSGGGSGGGGGGSTGSTGSSVRCGRRVVYVVRSGDNLFRIALRYRTTTLAIARLNGLTNTRQISTGQRLVIITCSGGHVRPFSRSYVVQPGDNLFRIALRYGTTAQSIRNANGLHSNLIVSGQVLYIP